MSISSELQDLNTNIENIKQTIVDAGGTVGNTGLSGIPSEIATIPSGGGGGTPYGKIWYSTTSRNVYVPAGGENVVIDRWDVGKFNNLSSVKSGIIDYNQLYIEKYSESSSDSWTMRVGWGTEMYSKNPWADWGIDLKQIPDTSGMGGMWSIYFNRLKIADPSNLQEMTLTSGDLDILTSNNTSQNEWPGTGEQLQLSGGPVNSNLIYKIELGNAPSNIPNNFMYGKCLMGVDFTYCTAETFGNYVFASSTVNPNYGYNFVQRPNLADKNWSVGTGFFQKFGGVQMPFPNFIFDSYDWVDPNDQM